MPLEPKNTIKVTSRRAFHNCATGLLTFAPYDKYYKRKVTIDVNSINRIVDRTKGKITLTLNATGDRSESSYDLTIHHDVFLEIWRDLKAGVDCDISEYSADKDYALDHWPADPVFISKVKEEERQRLEAKALEQAEEAVREQSEPLKTKAIVYEARWAR